MRESEFRNKITWMTFLFSLLVVWIHSYNAELFLGGTPEMAVLYRWEHFIGDTLGQLAVPGFFMISSYLFYRNFSMDKLWEKWNSRIHSILVPFILWNSLYYVGYVLGSRLPWIQNVIGKSPIPVNLPEIAEAILHYKYNYVFWYLYQLILLVVLAPVIYTLLKKRAVGVVVLAGLAAGLVMDVRLPYLNFDALWYYCFAAFAAIHGRGRAEGEQKGIRILAGLIALAAAGMLYISCGTAWAAWKVVISRTAAVGGLWFAIPETKLPEARSWMKHNFFLYATHFAFVRFINKAGELVLPEVLAVPLALYILMPFLVWGISILLGSMMRRYTPLAWKILNGGRI